MTARPQRDPADPSLRGYLSARPRAVAGPPLPAGAHALGLDGARDAFLSIPSGYTPEQPAPFVLALHGAGHNGRAFLDLWRPHADSHGVILLAPDSRGRTWDVLLGGFGPDVRFLDRALSAAFARCSVDTAHVAIEGFSDGASYALSLGVGNGELFTQIIANSPGFMHPAAQIGRPLIYIDHGTEDQVLPIDHCSRRLVPALRSAGYDVTYEEFAGGHRIPPEIAERCLDWWLSERQ
jgi:phospholipase/carboxylesterase